MSRKPLTAGAPRIASQVVVNEANTLIRRCNA
jgi:hypothetical protein